MIDDARALDGLATAGSRLTATISADTLARPVPPCPGWTLEDLVGHTGRVHRWAAGKVRRVDPPVARSADVPDGPPAGPEIASWFAAGVDDLCDVLATADLDAEVATWAGPRPARFWLRRMLAETTVHAWDAEVTVGAPSPIDLDVALDGVDEVLEAILPHRVDLAALGADGATIHLHGTDEGLPEGSGEWLITLGSETIEVDRTHAKGDVAVRGPVADLFLLLWARVPHRDLTVFGDATLLDRLAAASTL